MSRVGETIGKVMASPRTQQIMQAGGRAAQSVQSGIRGTSDPRLMFVDPTTGQRSATAAKGTALRSVFTIPEVQKLTNRMADHPVLSQVTSTLMDNPALRARVQQKSPIASNILDSISDNISQRQFDTQRRQALGFASAQAAGLAEKQRHQGVKAQSYDSAQRTLANLGAMGGRYQFDKDHFVSQTIKDIERREGRKVSEEEKHMLSDISGEIQKRAYDTKGSHVVHRRRPGGLSGQRLRTGMDEVSRRGQTATAKYHDSAQATQQATQKIQQINQLIGPRRRARGGYMDIGAIRDTWKQTGEGMKQASYNDIYLLLSQARDKLARTGSNNALEALSDRDFVARRSSKAKIIQRRDLDEEGGVNTYVNGIIYKNEGRVKDYSPSLLIILKKIKKELSFKDEIEYNSYY